MLSQTVQKAFEMRRICISLEMAKAVVVPVVVVATITAFIPAATSTTTSDAAAAAIILNDYQTPFLRTQLDVYQKQCAEFESGLGASSDTFGQFRTEMDRLGRKLREVEADTAEWRRKFESSSEQVRRMNAAAADREKELEAAK